MGLASVRDLLPLVCVFVVRATLDGKQQGFARRRMNVGRGGLGEERKGKVRSGAMCGVGITLTGPPIAGEAYPDHWVLYGERRAGGGKR